MKFSRYGTKELLQWGVLFPFLMALPVVTPIWLFGWWFLAPLLLAPMALAAFSFNFFRDPDRAVPGDEFTLVSPADGTVTDLAPRNEPEYFKREVPSIGIFLSVFDVHVNRSPLDGAVDYLSHREGKYLDARDPDCSTLNECQNIGARSKWGPRFYMRQISGKIAKHIVCPLKLGDEVKRGARFGMIKFGSRTELYLDDAFEVEWKAKKGDKVLGGATVLATLRSKGRPGDN